MEYIQQSFSVKFEYKVYFTSDLFNVSNDTVRDFLKKHKGEAKQKLFFVIDDGVAVAHPQIQQQIASYFQYLEGFELIKDVLIVPGGEACKNDMRYHDQIIEAVDKYGIDRHSYLIAIGGGAVLDLVGYCAAIAHRGVRHIRIPTTVLSQNDSGVGVKNAVNYKQKKNFLGSFTPPVAVFNDAQFLSTLSAEDYRSGISEAVKVALIKDADFFRWIKENAAALNKRDDAAMYYCIKKCAALHLSHISSGDPFELGSSRPLDFGHWSAHKVEQLSKFSIRHGEAVAMGIALDSVYSWKVGKIKQEDAVLILDVLLQLGFDITHPLMHIEDKNCTLLKGLEEFREHLGGRLTVTLLEAIGKGVEVHTLDIALLQKADAFIQNYKQA